MNGIPSFCAAAARLDIPLAEWNEQVHIIPAVHGSGLTDMNGNLVLMKSGSRMKELRNKLAAEGRDVRAVVNCGMDDEKVYQNAQDMPDEAGYFALIIAKER